MKKAATLITVTVNCELWLWIVTVNTWYETVNCEFVTVSELWLWKLVIGIVTVNKWLWIVTVNCDYELWLWISLWIVTVNLRISK